MMTIDAHVHLYPDEINRDPAAWAAAQGERHWAVLCTRRRRTPGGVPVQDFPSTDELLRAMDAAGVEHAVLQGWYWENIPNCAMHNRFYAGCVRRHPDRFTAFATIHPGAGVEAVVAELRRARDEGLQGLGELSPYSQYIPPSLPPPPPPPSILAHPALEAALELAAAWGWPVNLHVTDPQGRPYPGRVDTPLAEIGEMARRFPATKFVLAHWAGGLDVRELRNVWLDTAAAPLTHGDEAWRMIGRTCRAEQVIFGSDFPLRLQPARPAAEGLAAFAGGLEQAGAPAGVRSAHWQTMCAKRPGV
ncbi:amidohydrolase [Opitutaceae bacterium TAV3]|nr:amidohydrolase [Opitutaceae bacterium TAV3]